jgi:hypothetical protein
MEVALNEFDLTQLHDLKVGDVIEVPAFMPGLDDEAVVGMVTQTTKQTLAFRFTYHGVWIGNATLKKETNTWSKTSTESPT